MAIIFLALMIMIVAVDIDYNVDLEHYDHHRYCSRCAEGHRISKMPPRIFNRYNVTGFVEELPQLPLPENRFGHACAALPTTGVRPVQPFKPIAGICCCRRKSWIQVPFFCADSPPWSNRMDSPQLPPKNIVPCSRFDCGRQAQGDWGLGWWIFRQL